MIHQALADTLKAHHDRNAHLLQVSDRADAPANGSRHTRGRLRDRGTRWTAKVDEDARHGRQGSVRHWAYYSPLKDRLTSNIDALVAQLRSAMSRTSDDLDFSY